MNKFVCIFLSLLILSCDKLEFVYGDKERFSNPLYEKVIVTLQGKDLPYVKSYVSLLFGNKNNAEYALSININEKQTKRSVETNQVISNLSYELEFVYSLKSNILNCVIYNKEKQTAFDIIPKSSGYNYGTDISLEKKYELAIKENLNEFILDLSGINLTKCK